MSEELGIIRNPGYGMRDTNRPVLWFEVNTLSGSSLQVMSQPQADEFLLATGVYDVRRLDGRVVVMELDNLMYRIVRVADV
jgi:hypothetical protein